MKRYVRLSVEPVQLYYSKMKQIWNVAVYFTSILHSPVGIEAPSR